MEPHKKPRRWFADKNDKISIFTCRQTLQLQFDRQRQNACVINTQPKILHWAVHLGTELD